MENTWKKSMLTTRTMTVTAILGVISVVLSITPLGYIPISLPPLTIMHIPVIIAAVVEGPIVGMMVGFIFGLTSLIRNFMIPTPVSFVFLNPLVSILPRILIGFTSYYTYRGFSLLTRKKSLSYICAGLVGSLTNSVGVLSMIYFLYAQRYLETIHADKTFFKYIIGVFTANSIPEAILAAFLVLSIGSALAKILKK